MLHRRMRLLTTSVVVLVVLLFLNACAPQVATKPVETEPIRVVALNGPTGMGLIELIKNNEEQKSLQPYTFTLVATPDEIVAQLVSGQADIAALPTNLAAVLYQKTEKKIRLLAVNTLGVLSILEKGDEITQFSDLAGRTVTATGEAAVPEYVINDLLERSQLTDAVQVDYLTEHAELATRAAAGDLDLVLLPEPFATSVLMKNEDMRRALDLTEVWQAAHAEDDSELIMGCMVVTEDFSQANPQAVKTFLKEYEGSVETVNSKPEQAGEWIAEHKIIGDPQIAARAIPNCHIVLITGEEMVAKITPFYAVLFSADPKSVGGTLPDQQFYLTP